MTRHEVREHIFRLLFMVEFHEGEELKEQAALYFDEVEGISEKNHAYILEKLENMMMNTGMLTKDLGTILVGQEAVDCGLINEVGGIRDAMKKLHEMIDEGAAQQKG